MIQGNLKVMIIDNLKFFYLFQFFCYYVKIIHNKVPKFSRMCCDLKKKISIYLFCPEKMYRTKFWS